MLLSRIPPTNIDTSPSVRESKRRHAPDANSLPTSYKKKLKCDPDTNSTVHLDSTTNSDEVQSTESRRHVRMVTFFTTLVLFSSQQNDIEPSEDRNESDGNYSSVRVSCLRVRDALDGCVV